MFDKVDKGFISEMLDPVKRESAILQYNSGRVLLGIFVIFALFVIIGSLIMDISTVGIKHTEIGDSLTVLVFLIIAYLQIDEKVKYLKLFKQIGINKPGI